MELWVGTSSKFCQKSILHHTQIFPHPHLSRRSSPIKKYFVQRIPDETNSHLFLFISMMIHCFLFVLFPFRHKFLFVAQGIPFETISASNKEFITFSLVFFLFSFFSWLMMIYVRKGYLKDGNPAYMGSMMGRAANRYENYL